MSMIHDEYRRLQKKYNKEKEHPEEKKEDPGKTLSKPIDIKAPDAKPIDIKAPDAKRPTIKDKIWQKIKPPSFKSDNNKEPQDDKKEIRIEYPKPGPDKIKTKEDKTMDKIEIKDKGEGTMRARVLMLLERIAKIQDMQKKLIKENEENKAQLENTEKLIDTYRFKISQLEKEKNTLQSEMSEKDRTIKSFEGKDKGSGEVSDEMQTLEAQRKAMEQRIAQLEWELLKGEKNIEGLQTDFGEEVVKGTQRERTDRNLQRKLTLFELRLKKQEEIIVNLLHKKKVTPEQERLLIVWLNASLRRERNISTELKDKIKELQQELASKKEEKKE